MGNTKLYHRGCCHGFKTVDEDFVSPMQQAIEAFGTVKPKKSHPGYTQKQIKQMYDTATKEEAQFGESLLVYENLIRNDKLHPSNSFQSLLGTGRLFIFHASSENEEFNEGECAFEEWFALCCVTNVPDTSCSSCRQIYHTQTAHVPSTATPHTIDIVSRSKNGKRISEDLLSEFLISSRALGVELLYCEFSFSCAIFSDSSRVSTHYMLHAPSHSYRKRLRLPIAIMIHVEHDPVAVAVSKYNNNDDDNIDHHYIDEFEQVYGKGDEVDDELFASFVNKYGPIDLVLSAAPCQSYSGLNARGDRSSDNAQYLLKVGRLIHKLNNFQLTSLGVKDEVLFLSENVVFGDHDEVDKSYGIGADEGLTPMCVDAKDFGPCKRKRFYWINVSIFLNDIFSVSQQRFR